jgi:predicted SnoaL-like aldol condensation-catalyzing enzyme
VAAFDLFRFKNGRIVEHWDVLMPMGAPNVSGHGTVDGPAAIADLGRTEANRTPVRKFVETVLAGKQFDRAGEFLDANRYVQHNQTLGDGLNAFNAAVAAARKSGIDITYKPHRILAEGNFVFVQSEGGSGSTQVCDLFRLHDGKIVEHWDVLAPIAPRDQWKNNNGPF